MANGFKHFRKGISWNDYYSKPLLSFFSSSNWLRIPIFHHHWLKPIAVNLVLEALECRYTRVCACFLLMSGNEDLGVLSVMDGYWEPPQILSSYYWQSDGETWHKSCQGSTAGFTERMIGWWGLACMTLQRKGQILSLWASALFNFQNHWDSFHTEFAQRTQTFSENYKEHYVNTFEFISSI